MTREELLAKLEAYEYKNISYTTAQTISAIGAASQAEKEALAGAVNAQDASLVGAIIITLFQSKRTEDAKSAAAAKIKNDQIDIDDVAAALNGY